MRIPPRKTNVPRAQSGLHDRLGWGEGAKRNGAEGAFPSFPYHTAQKMTSVGFEPTEL